MDLLGSGAWTLRCAFKRLGELIEEDLTSQFATLHAIHQNLSLPVQGLMALQRFTSRILISKCCLSQNKFLLVIFSFIADSE